MIFIDIKRRKIGLVFVFDESAAFPSTKLHVVGQLAVNLSAKLRIRIL